MSSSHTVIPMSSADPIFGRLTVDSLAFLHEPILMGTFIVSVLLGLIALGAITKFKLWKPLWNDWLTSVDHKKIGIMYIVVALVMLVRGFADAVMMTSHQALAVSQSFMGAGYLPPEHYDQVFSAHGVIMIFFVATPILAGLMNLAVPLQIGARDVAYPMLNSLSFWMFVCGAVLAMISLFVGEFANTGWLNYVPLSGIELNPWVGVDYWIWAIQLSGIGSTLTAVNFIATILMMRAPGMTLWKMPMFTWTVLAANAIAIMIFPIFAAAIAMLTFDRYLGTHFFTSALGGNQMMWVNLVWAWGHPEVYYLFLPALGIMADVTSTFSKKKLFGYKSMVWATLTILILSMIVWLHHFFTMGSGASVNAFFGITTMMIGIPTGVKLFNYIFTMYKGKVEFSAAMWWILAFLTTFTIGGMTGVMLSIPSNDFVLHNSIFLVAHFHNTIIGGAVFGYFAGVTYWYPKAMGHKLDEKLGKIACAFWVSGFYVAWMPKYFAGLDGMTRRLNYITDASLQPLLYVSFCGALLIACGIAVQVYNFVISFVRRNDPKYDDVTGDPWGGRTLEWSVSSPPPHYNFATTPHIDELDDFYYKKQKGEHVQPKSYSKIHMPKYTSAGAFIGVLSIIFGFAMIWYMWWLAVISFLGIIVVWLKYSFNRDKDYYVQVDEIEKDEAKYWEAFNSHKS